MGWLKQLLMTCIILSAAVCVSCQELASTLREGNRTCPGEEVIFNCTIRGSSTLPVLALEWRSAEYIGQDGSLQLSTADSLGAVEESVMDGIITATATLISSTNIGGMLILVSTLRIVANEASVVTCSGTNEVTESIEFSISAIPEVPQRIRAAEVSQTLENICIILVEWDPPANTAGSDIDHYIVYVPSRNINSTVSFTISILSIRNCGDDLRVQVAAVNRVGCVGMNSSAVQPILLDIPTERGSTTTDSGSAITTSTTTTTTGSLSDGAIVGITIGGTVLVCVLIFGAIGAVIFVVGQTQIKEEKRDVKSGVEMEPLSSQVSKLLSVIDYDLQELYEALISKSMPSIRIYARSLTRKINKDQPQVGDDVIQKALIEFLKEVNDNEDMVDALDTLTDLVQVQSIHDSMELMVRSLEDGAGKKNGFNFVIEAIEQETPSNVKDILMRLCEPLRRVQDEDSASGINRPNARRTLVSPFIDPEQENTY